MTRDERHSYWTRTGILILLSLALCVVPLAALHKLLSNPDAWHRLFTPGGLFLFFIILLIPLILPFVILAKWLGRKARHGRYLPSSEEFQAFKARERQPRPPRSAWRDVALAVMFGAETVNSGLRLLRSPLMLNWNLVAVIFFAVATLLFAWAPIGAASRSRRLARLPLRDGFACPKCGAKPPIGPLWKCRACGKPFDTFATQTVCPYCSASHGTTMCGSCNASSPIADWERASSNPGAVLVNGVPLSM